MALSEIHNYYEDLVENYIDALELKTTRDEDYLADLYCLALNQLPVHYIRHGVDMYFYMSDEKRQEMEEKVIYAVTAAISWLDNEIKEKEEEKKKLKDIERQKIIAEQEAKQASEDVAHAVELAKQALKRAEEMKKLVEDAQKSVSE